MLIQNEFEEEALNWEAREFELEKMVATLEEERDRVISISDDIVTVFYYYDFFN